MYMPILNLVFTFFFKFGRQSKMLFPDIFQKL